MRNPIAEEKVRQASLQATLIKLLQRATGTADMIADGLVRITITAANLTAIAPECEDLGITPDQYKQFIQEHPFGLEVNISDKTKRAESDVADNVLDINLANLHAVAMAQSDPIDETGRRTITQAYERYQQQRLFLRRLNIPEKEKIKRANTVVKHFFNLVGSFLHHSRGYETDKLPKQISHWLQEFRSERAQRNHISIQVANDKYITDIFTKTNDTSLHIQSYRRWYMRRDVPTVSETAHNYKSEVPNYGAITEASAVLHSTAEPTVYVSHIGQSHGSLTPAIEYSTFDFEHDTKKHALILKAHTNMQRVMQEDQRLTGIADVPHVYTHLLTVSRTHGALQGQVNQFLDLRVASYALPNMIYMDYGINSARDHINPLQTGINNIAMVDLYQNFAHTIAANAEFRPLETLHPKLHKNYTESKLQLTAAAETYINLLHALPELEKKRDDLRRTAPKNNGEANQKRNRLEYYDKTINSIDALHENITKLETTVHLHAAELADIIKFSIDRESVQTAVTTPLTDDSSDEEKSHHYAKQAMFVIQQLRKMNSDSSGIKSKYLTQQKISWISDEANGVIQAMIQILSSSIGIHSSSGCKSANDRQYVVAATVSALAKKMERGEAIATDDLKSMLTELNSQRQAEYGKSAAALQTVFDNGGYPKSKGGTALSKPITEPATGAGTRTSSASLFTRLRKVLETSTAPTVPGRKEQGKASDSFASHKIKSRSIDLDDPTTKMQLEICHLPNDASSLLEFAIKQIKTYQATLIRLKIPDFLSDPYKLATTKRATATLIDNLEKINRSEAISPANKIQQSLDALSKTRLFSLADGFGLDDICKQLIDHTMVLHLGDIRTLELTTCTEQHKSYDATIGAFLQHELALKAGSFVTPSSAPVVAAHDTTDPSAAAATVEYKEYSDDEDDGDDPYTRTTFGT
ncbi:MAG: hypothetical protein P1U63_04800 [Coxiellaceae bacterium]|nr:hypothetical protein [Coxiellaceae bacterium]